MMTLSQRLKRLMAVVIEKAESDPEFRRMLDEIFAIEGPKRLSEEKQRPHRRAPGPFDPFEIFRDGENALRTRLNSLSLEELRNIIAEHGMDPNKLVMKWKDPQRVADHIISTVATRTRKGAAFLQSPIADSGEPKSRLPIEVPNSSRENENEKEQHSSERRNTKQQRL